MGQGIYCDVRSIEVPDKVHDLIPVVSVSGGKDSTAVCLALTEAGIEHRRVFADTGWEHSSTYEHLDLLREKLGPIDVVGVPGGMMARMHVRAGFPSRMQRWCTKELKLQPLIKYHDAIRDTEGDTVSVVGIRADESQSRSRMLPFGDDDRWGGYVWRPILDWTVEDVIAIHHRHGVPLHPLYLQGMSRVGCWPCIFARKEEIRMVSEIDPGRVDLIRCLESEFVQLRLARNIEKPGRYTYPEDATFFQSIDRRRRRRRVDCAHCDGADIHCSHCGGSGKVESSMRGSGIDDVVAWSRTTQGGTQLSLIQEPPSGGCFQWGLCEPPSENER